MKITDSFGVRPVPEYPKLFFIVGYGPDLDIARATTDVEYLLQWIHAVTKHSDVTIDRVSTLADWRYGYSDEQSSCYLSRV